MDAHLDDEVIIYVVLTNTRVSRGDIETFSFTFRVSPKAPSEIQNHIVA